MPNQNAKSISENLLKYDAGDMHDLASLAECDLGWSSFAIQDIQIRVRKIKEELTARYSDAQYHFSSLEKALEMYEYIIDDRHNSHAKEAERLEQEWQNNKGGRNA